MGYEISCALASKENNYVVFASGIWFGSTVEKKKKKASFPLLHFVQLYKIFLLL